MNGSDLSNAAAKEIIRIAAIICGLFISMAVLCTIIAVYIFMSIQDFSSPIWSTDAPVEICIMNCN